MSLITTIVVFFALLFVPCVGPFIAILWLAAAGNAMYAPSSKREKLRDAAARRHVERMRVRAL